MSETITVTGKAKLSIPPYTICVTLLMGTIRDTYEDRISNRKEAVVKNKHKLVEVIQDTFKSTKQGFYEINNRKIY